ncbi:uncharacterized protein LOC128235683 [Mya arenaria]|uniref:uncharacterized protein LOC128235683 n=1 Tax=Mya arenaria TaxID=6604 RepID=UPI0022E85B15|nr:uncharacterized protein LOC128235683 [Mya arenaria]
MLGELPLFTAALSLNKEMFEDLLDYKEANLHERNSKEDDIYHALIRYAHYYPNKEDEVIEILKLIQTQDETKQNGTKADVENADTTNDISKTVKHADKITLEDQTKDTSKEPKPGILWSMKNDSGLNPLELATKSGLCKIFGTIYNSEPYFIEHGNDGLNDIKTYDITDLDPVVTSDACNDFADSGSILQFLFQIHPSLAFPFIRTPQVSKIIEEKWKYYKWINLALDDKTDRRSRRPAQFLRY